MIVSDSSREELNSTIVAAEVAAATRLSSTTVRVKIGVSDIGSNAECPNVWTPIRVNSLHVDSIITINTIWVKVPEGTSWV